MPAELPRASFTSFAHGFALPRRTLQRSVGLSFGQCALQNTFGRPFLRLKLRSSLSFLCPAVSAWWTETKSQPATSPPSALSLFGAESLYVDQGGSPQPDPCTWSRTGCPLLLQLLLGEAAGLVLTMAISAMISDQTSQSQPP